MGKDKSIVTSKSMKKKKKKSRENDLSVISSKRKSIANLEDDNSDYCDYNLDNNEEEFKTLPHIIESPSSQKHNNGNSISLGSSKKKSKHKNEFLDYESPKKKSKKDKELSEDDYKNLKKSKNDKKSSSKKKTNEDNLLKHSTKSQLQLDDTSEHEEEEESKEDKKGDVIPGPEIVSLNTNIEEETGWPKDDVSTLLQNITKVIPQKDNLKYTSRCERLDWAKIAFSDHTPEECKEKWKLVAKNIRQYRIMEEMVNDAKLWIEKPWSHFKKTRHPDMPRRPLSSYMLFYLAKKAKFSKKHPDLAMPDLSKIIGDKFNKLPESKKQKLANLAKALREEYNEKMQKFTETHPEVIIGAKKINKEKIQMPGPKRPLPPFRLFLEEKLKLHDENDGLSKMEYMAQIKDLWKNLSAKKKVHWIRWAQENEKNYLEELENYKSENPNFEMPKIKSLLSKEEITILERMNGKPEKPPNSAYSLFSRLMLKDDQIKLMKISPKERMQEISNLWSAVSDEEKKQYQEKCKHLLDLYKLEYATYLESLPEDKREIELAKTQSRKRKKKDPVNKSGKKLKQTKISDLTKKMKVLRKKVKEKPASSDEYENEQTDKENEADSDQKDKDDILKNPKKLKEIKSKIEALDPPKPNLDAFELFKEVYLSNPANKVSRAKMIWDSMPKKEKERYQIKMERQKQEYILNYKNFLTKLQPDEIKIYYMMKNELSSLAPQLSDSSEGEASEDEDDDLCDEDNKQRNKNISARKTENTTSGSESSD